MRSLLGCSASIAAAPTGPKAADASRSLSPSRRSMPPRSSCAERTASLPCCGQTCSRLTLPRAELTAPVATPKGNLHSKSKAETSLAVQVATCRGHAGGSALHQLPSHERRCPRGPLRAPPRDLDTGSGHHMPKEAVLCGGGPGLHVLPPRQLLSREHCRLQLAIAHKATPLPFLGAHRGHLCRQSMLSGIATLRAASVGVPTLPTSGAFTVHSVSSTFARAAMSRQLGYPKVPQHSDFAFKLESQRARQNPRLSHACMRHHAHGCPRPGVRGRRTWPGHPRENPHRRHWRQLWRCRQTLRLLRRRAKPPTLFGACQLGTPVPVQSLIIRGATGSRRVADVTLNHRELKDVQKRHRRRVHETQESPRVPGHRGEEVHRVSRRLPEVLAQLDPPTGAW
mmetsp:Transcript_60744/g.177446  ORF Transcript_60744/g.177446 Transcript_60744/m.177446 type:complete len:397 (+) Transcript_60744:1051-2241(+)